MAGFTGQDGLSQGEVFCIEHQGSPGLNKDLVGALAGKRD